MLTTYWILVLISENLDPVAAHSATVHTARAALAATLARGLLQGSMFFDYRFRVVNKQQDRCGLARGPRTHAPPPAHVQVTAEAGSALL